MARIRPTDVVFTGLASVMVSPGAAIAPARWAAKEARLARMDRLCGLALVACDGALVDAALSPAAAEWNGDRTAVVLGTAYGCHATNEEYYKGVVREGASGASPRLFAYTLPSSPVGEISIHYGVRGPASTLAAGVASGIDALAEGVALVANGRADRAVVCAAEVATPLLARLLGARGDGLVDAAAAVVVERASDAAARGAVPRGRLLGAAAAFDADVPASAVAAAMQRALAQADVGSAAATRVPTLPTALAAGPLIALAAWLASAPRDALALIAVGDEGGAGSAAVIVAAGDAGD